MAKSRRHWVYPVNTVILWYNNIMSFSSLKSKRVRECKNRKNQKLIIFMRPGVFVPLRKNRKTLKK